MRMKIAWMLAGGMQQRGHPVVAAGRAEVRLDLGHLVGAGLVPGDHHVEQVAVDREILDGIDGARRHAPRRLGRQRYTGLGRAALEHRHRVLALAQLQHPRDEPQRALGRVAVLEENAVRRQLGHGHLARQGEEVLVLHPVEGREAAQQRHDGSTLAHQNSLKASRHAGVRQAGDRSTGVG